MRFDLGPILRLVRRSPGKAFGGLACVVLMGGIAANAVFLQRGHHPAPLFGSGPKPGDNLAEAPVPQPVPRPAQDELPATPIAEAPFAAAEESTSEAGAAPRSPPFALRPDHRSAKALPGTHPAGSRPDGIAKLIEGKAAADAGGEEASVVAAQKALVKLGYTLKPDGRMGTATRDALQKFQQDRHIDADGTLSPKLLRTLQRAAGSTRG